ncbi:thiolase family protein [Rubrobacter aplysinae]|uniref:thiolase family protein n=1 Tax=Rubrobacter aplysinae TaxID=909625 RepID=UPI00064C2BA4|nr:thiolase family protein [Rubrobacter aplysinae]
MGEAVIVEAVRTPFGKRGGAFRETRPDALLARTLRGLVERAGLDDTEVEDVVTGCVTQAGEQGANVGRLGVLLAGFPVEVPAVTLNRMCGSSQQAVHFASQAIAAGDMSYAIGCGVESMTRAPMFSDIGGGFEKLNPDLLEKQELIHQGESAERIADRWGITREDADSLSASSHQRAGGRSEWPEILPTTGLDKEGNEVKLSVDEGVRPSVDSSKMAALDTVFREDGVVTAGNASQLSDGASAVLVADRERAEADGLKPKARFLSRVAVGDDPALQLTGVIPATRAALKKAGISINDLDWIEINEAFATVALSWADELKPDMDRVNPWGGAIAHGHPLGATGGGLMAKLVAGLESTDGQLGLQVMCIGHGMATATVIERI